MKDYFKELREPLIEQQQRSDEKQDELITQLKDNEDKIVEAISYDPTKALTYDGEIVPEMEWIEDTDEEYKKPSTSFEKKETSTSFKKKEPV